MGCSPYSGELLDVPTAGTTPAFDATADAADGSEAAPDAGLDAAPDSAIASDAGLGSDADAQPGADSATADCGADDDDAGCVEDCESWCASRPAVARSLCNLAGECVVERCLPGYADCDGVAANGCERDTQADGSCLPDASCDQAELDGHRYFFCRNSFTWAEAAGRCRSQPGGALLHLETQAELEFVMARVSGASWIGANDRDLEGLWRWADDGVPFWRGTAGGEALLSGFNSWGSDQPDGAADDEDCAQLRQDGTWGDQRCDNIAAFVCEVGADRCPDDDKRSPGQCGCAEPDLDPDGDGFAQCNDACPQDPNKLAPGGCGCGVADGNRDADS